MRVKRSCKIERFFVTHWPPKGYTSPATAMTPYTVKVSPNPHKLTVRPPPLFRGTGGYPSRDGRYAASLLSEAWREARCSSILVVRIRRSNAA